MGSKWPTSRLEDLTELIVDCPHSTPKWTDNGEIVLRSQNIRNGRLDLSSPSYTDNDGYLSRIKRALPQAEDLIFTREAPMGEVCMIPHGLKCCMGQRMVQIRTKRRSLSPHYLLYLLQSPFLQHQIGWNEGTGTTVSNIRIPNIRGFEIPTPPLPEQKAIAHILGSLDDKIELNRRMNATLEGMAQALFKSWFVDFDPVIDNALAAGNPIPDELAARAEVRRQALVDGTANREAAIPLPAAFQQTDSMGWIPEGWEAAKLSDLLEVKYGKDHKKLGEGSIPVYGSGGLMRHADKSLYSGESVLIPRKGTLSNILYLNAEFWTVDTMFYTIPKHKYSPKYAFYYLKGLDFTSMNVGSAVPSMTTKVLNELPIVMPDGISLKHFDEILSAYFGKSAANNKQSQSLAKLRDTLLSKLISGDLRTPESEQLTERTLA